MCIYELTHHICGMDEGSVAGGLDYDHELYRIHLLFTYSVETN